MTLVQRLHLKAKQQSASTTTETQQKSLLEKLNEKLYGNRVEDNLKQRKNAFLVFEKRVAENESLEIEINQRNVTKRQLAQKLDLCRRILDNDEKNYVAKLHKFKTDLNEIRDRTQSLNVEICNKEHLNQQLKIHTESQIDKISTEKRIVSVLERRVEIKQADINQNLKLAQQLAHENQALSNTINKMYSQNKDLHQIQLEVQMKHLIANKLNKKIVRSINNLEYAIQLTKEELQSLTQNKMINEEINKKLIQLILSQNYTWSRTKQNKRNNNGCVQYECAIFSKRKTYNVIEDDKQTELDNEQDSRTPLDVIFFNQNAQTGTIAARSKSIDKHIAQTHCEQDQARIFKLIKNGDYKYLESIDENVHVSSARKLMIQKIENILSTLDEVNRQYDDIRKRRKCLEYDEHVEKTLLENNSQTDVQENENEDTASPQEEGTEYCKVRMNNSLQESKKE